MTKLGSILVAAALLGGATVPAWAADKNARAGAQPDAVAHDARGEWTVVGTLVAVGQGGKTIVVDSPSKKGTMRVGATVTKKTQFMHDGKTVMLSELRDGERVRLTVRRLKRGDEALSAEVLGK
jgi:hypothetical protein